MTRPCWSLNIKAEFLQNGNIDRNLYVKLPKEAEYHVNVL